MDHGDGSTDHLSRQTMRIKTVMNHNQENDQKNRPHDLKNDIDEIDRKQADRQREEREVREQRGELLRGHRTTVYKSTNTDSTPTVWCNICNRWDKPHSHPISK